MTAFESLRVSRSGGSGYRGAGMPLSTRGLRWAARHGLEALKIWPQQTPSAARRKLRGNAFVGATNRF